jgi:hypothetical protein
MAQRIAVRPYPDCGARGAVAGVEVEVTTSHNRSVSTERVTIWTRRGAEALHRKLGRLLERGRP